MHIRLMRDYTLAKRNIYLNFTHVSLITSFNYSFHFYGLNNRAEEKHGFKMVKKYEGYSWNSFL